MIRFKICFFHSNYILVSLFVGIIYETSLQKSSDCWSKKQETIHRATSFDFRSLEQRVEAKSRRGNSDYELCKIKWNGGDKALFDRPARRATWRWIKQQAHQDYAAGVYSRLLFIRRRLKATFSHDDSLLRYSPDFFTLEREGVCACMLEERERESYSDTRKQFVPVRAFQVAEFFKYRVSSSMQQ